ncbi:MAG TPA: class I SAM-dependent methyltransferase [Patescibacteria group bacterium]|nr:class I SAM-dependent methyltransferase [Patescibacteria group bacterium]
MSNSEESAYDRLAAVYATGDVPWDDQDPPPEVIAFLASIPAGKALDLGCGYGRAAIYMAQLGWEVDAVDFIPEAIVEAARRASSVHVVVRFHLTKVTDLYFLAGTYDFALDVGCSHGLNPLELHVYRDHLLRLINPGGVYMLFARIQDGLRENSLDGPPGMDLQEIQALYGKGFNLEWMERGRTQAGKDDDWSSAWFRFHRV